MSTIRAAKTFWQRWSERFRPDEASPLDTLRARAGAALALGTLPLALLLACSQSLLNDGRIAPLARTLHLGLLPFALALAALAWWRCSLAVLLHGLAAYVFMAACVLSHQFGGPRLAPSLLWLVPIPAALLSLMGRAHALPWLIATLVACAGFFLADELAYPFPDMASPAERAGAWISSLLGVTLLMALFVIAYERAKSDGLVTLEGTSRALRKARDRAAERRHARCDLLARVCRSLRAPLASVLSVGDALGGENDGGGEARGTTPLAAIRRNARRLLAALDDLSDLAELESGTLKLRSSRCSPRALSEELIAAMQPKAEAHEIGLDLELAADAPEAIDTDPSRIKQILVAVLSEALARRPAPRVLLRVTRESAGVGFTVVEPRAIAARQGTPAGAAGSAAARSPWNAMTLAGGLVRGLIALLGAELRVLDAPEGALTRLHVPLRLGEVAGAGSLPSTAGAVVGSASAGVSNGSSMPLADKHLNATGDEPAVGRIEAWIEPLVRAIVPSRLAADVEIMRRGRSTVYVAFGLALGVLIALLALPYVFEPPAVSPLRSMLVGCLPAIVAAPWVLRWTGSSAVGPQLLLGCGWLLVFCATWLSGGVGSPASFWNVLIPLLGVVLGGSRTSLVWAAVSLLGAGVFLWIERSWGAPVNHLRSAPIALITCASLGTLSVLAYAVLALHERATTATFDGLARVHADLEGSRSGAERTEASMREEALQIGHELRTPLTSILGFADVLLEEPIGTSQRPDDRKHLREIRRQGRRMLAILDDWSAITQLDAHAAETKRERFGPAELLLRVLEKAESLAEPGALEIEAALAHPIPEWIEGDAPRIEASLVAFIEHALADVTEGKLRMVAAIQAGADTLWLSLRIERSDLGPLDGPTREPECPSGPSGDLHLTLCRKLVGHLGGRLELQSLRRRGGATCVSLPVGASDEDALTHLASASNTGEGPDPSSIRLELRILVAEDGADNRRLIRHLLERLGAEAVFVENGELALRRALFAEAEQRPFDAVLMDLQMPEVDGYESTRTLRDAGFIRPIIALTAHAMESERERCLAAGFDGFAVKPIDRASLVAALLEARARIKLEPASR